MNGDQKKWAGRVLKFAVSSALMITPVAGCGSSEEGETAVMVNEPMPEEPTGGGDDTGGGGGETPEPDGPHVNEPAPSE
jgi:hypothetical protein